MESIYTELALYSSKNECARTNTVFWPIAEVCDGKVSLTFRFLRHILAGVHIVIPHMMPAKIGALHVDAGQNMAPYNVLQSGRRPKVS